MDRQTHTGGAKAHAVTASLAAQLAKLENVADTVEKCGYPCLFCGFRDYVVRSTDPAKTDGKTWYYVECVGCHGRGPWEPTPMLARRHWAEGWWIDVAWAIRENARKISQDR